MICRAEGITCTNHYLPPTCSSVGGAHPTGTIYKNIEDSKYMYEFQLFQTLISVITVSIVFTTHMGYLGLCLIYTQAHLKSHSSDA